MNTQEKQLKSLQTFAKNITSMFDIKIYKSEDKRKKDLFYLTYFGTCKSPKLNYSEMNTFLLGFYRCLEMQKSGD
jgi:hypothetical protein